MALARRWYSLPTVLLTAVPLVTAGPGPVQGEDTQQAPDTVEVRQLAADINTLAFDSYQNLRPDLGNFFFSPFSISSAFSLTYAGARGETAEEMKNVLKLSLSPERLHAAHGALREVLDRPRVKEGLREEGAWFELEVASMLWAHESFSFSEAFIETAVTHYDGGIRPVNLKTPEHAVEVINEWVRTQTKDRIDRLVERLDPLPNQLILTDAVYFRGSWDLPFSTRRTIDEPFYPLGGDPVKVPMMVQTGVFRYGEGDGYQAIALGYFGGIAEMLVFLPNPGKFDDFEDALDAGFLSHLQQDLPRTEVRLSLPRFDLASQVDLVPHLQELGLTQPFGRDADFSGITTAERLWIGQAVHRASVSVDEEGTEAAAATAVMLKTLGRPEEKPEPVEFRADRPFTVVIRDRATGVFLFVGRVLNPKES